MHPFGSSWFCISCSTSSSLIFSPESQETNPAQWEFSLTAALKRKHLCAVRLTQCCQNVPELSSHDGAVPLLVKDPQTLHKVLITSTVLGPADVLVDGEELVKVKHLGLHLCGNENNEKCWFWPKSKITPAGVWIYLNLSLYSTHIWHGARTLTPIQGNPSVSWGARYQPSGFGFPRTYMISAFVGFWPKALTRSPHWA